MIDYLVAIFVLLGSFFGLVAAVGVLRLPDMFNRAHAATKAGAFGGILLLVGTVIAFHNLRSVMEAGLIFIAFYATAPVAAQMLGRIAYRLKVPSHIPPERDAWKGQD